MIARPATSSTLKEINLRTVLDVIRTAPPVSRAEIARRTGISKPTVSALLQDLLEMGLVSETVREELGPTYGALFFAPRPEAAHILALDVGARRLRGAVADLEGVIHIRRDVPVEGMDAHQVVGTAAALAEELCAEAGIGRSALQHAAIGVPGVVDRRDGRIWQATNVPALDGFLARDAFEKALALPVTVENDIHLAALGEQRHGTGGSTGTEAESFVFLSVGTGVGAGLILHGELHRGFAGAAGELDCALEPETFDENDPCAVAILQYAARRLPGHKELSTEQVFELARAGDEDACAVVDEEARRISGYLSTVAAVVDVELVVLGGGIGLNGDLLLPRIRRRLEERLPYPPVVGISALGDAAVLTGAVAVATREALEQILSLRFGPPGRRRG